MGSVDRGLPGNERNPQPLLAEDHLKYLEAERADDDAKVDFSAGYESQFDEEQ